MTPNHPTTTLNPNPGNTALPQPAEPPAAAIRLTRDPRGRLLFFPAEKDKPVENVRVARCFPWSLRDRYISIRDSEGHELALVTDPNELDPETRNLLQAELDAQEFIPTITRIAKVVDHTDLTLWHVVTDRGPVELRITHAEDVQQLQNGRILLKDHAGGLFQIQDPAILDARSRTLLEDHLA